MIDDEVVSKYDSLVKTVNSIRDFSTILPSDLLQNDMLLQFVLYFVEPTVASLEGLVSMHGVLLTDDEKDSIFPQVIEFLVYLKSKIAGV